MDPQDLIRKTLRTHFKRFGKIRKKCQYTPSDNPVYNPVTGKTTPVATGEPVEVFIIISDFDMSRAYSPEGYTSSRIDMSTDKMGIVPSEDLAYVPEAGDYIKRLDTGVEFEVLGLFSDPSESVRLIHLRA